MVYCFHGPITRSGKCRIIYSSRHFDLPRHCDAITLQFDRDKGSIGVCNHRHSATVQLRHRWCILISRIITNPLLMRLPLQFTLSQESGAESFWPWPPLSRVRKTITIIRCTSTSWYIINCITEHTRHESFFATNSYTKTSRAHLMLTWSNLHCDS